MPLSQTRTPLTNAQCPNAHRANAPRNSRSNSSVPFCTAPDAPYCFVRSDNLTYTDCRPWPVGCGATNGAPPAGGDTSYCCPAGAPGPICQDPNAFCAWLPPDAAPPVWPRACPALCACRCN